MKSSDPTNPKKSLPDEDYAARMNRLDQAANHSLLDAVLKSVAAGHYSTQTRNMLVVILRTLKQHELANTIIELPPRTFSGPPVDWQLADGENATLGDLKECLAARGTFTEIEGIDQFDDEEICLLVKAITGEDTIPFTNAG